VNTICLDPHSDPLWHKLVDHHNSDVFHSPEWIRTLTKSYDFDVRALVVLDSTGEPSAGLAYCKLEDMMDPRISSLPFSDFCDPLVIDRDHWNCLMDELLTEQSRINLRCLHNTIPLGDDRLNLVSEDKWHCVNLQPDLDMIWNSLHSSARRAIKKAQRDGVVVRIAQGKEELRAFFELHLGVRKYKYHLLAQPYRFFENIWDQFIEKQKGTLMVAVYQGEIIGGVMFLEWKDRLYYKFNASNPALIAHRPNDLVIWEGIKYGKSRGHTYLDFGISDGDQEGLLRYKRKYATDEKTISSLRYRPNGTPTQKEIEMRALLPQLTDLFVDESVPDCVTERAGDVLYRFFS
jgi:CelD/BcsL family acetyltransferase involved in cellulose biosynthesis